MLLRTHKATAVAITYYFDYHFFSSALPFYIRGLLYLIAIISQDLIDGVGHTVYVTRSGRRIPARNKYHSVYFLTPLSLLLGAVLYYITGLDQMLYYPLALTYAHLIEDMVTESGIRIYGKVKIRPPITFSYDNPVINRLVIALCLFYILFHPLNLGTPFNFFLFIFLLILELYYLVLA